eukprot:926377-Pyramimonas_sp.AAC.1
MPRATRAAATRPAHGQPRAELSLPRLHGTAGLEPSVQLPTASGRAGRPRGIGVKPHGRTQIGKAKADCAGHGPPQHP